MMDASIPAGYGPGDDVDHDAADPVWLQMAAILLARIRSGVYPPRRVMPSEVHLVQEFGVARGTARKAVALLAEKGHVRTVQGRGTYVADTER